MIDSAQVAELLRPAGRSPRRAIVAVTMLVAGATAAVLALVLSHDGAPQGTAVVSSRGGLDGQATWAAGVRPAPAIDTLRDQSGHLFSLASLHGRTVAVVFFDSHCNQECPLEGRALAQAETRLPASERPVLVAVSVNPADTPASARHAARAWGLAAAAPWHWLMGARASLAKVWAAYHIYVGRSEHGDIPHTEAVILIDRRGDERSAYLYPFASRFVTHDLAVLAGRRA